MKKLWAAYIAACLFLGGFLLVVASCQEPTPMEQPTLQAKTVHIMTADERSEILIYDIWKPEDLSRVEIGKGAALGIQPVQDAPREPYGWQAFVSQDAVPSLIGDMSAYAYQGM